MLVSMVQPVLQGYPQGESLNQSFCLEQTKNIPLLLLHKPGVSFAAALMIVAKEVQDAVQEKKIKLVHKRQTGFGSIAGSSVGRDDDIA